MWFLLFYSVCEVGNKNIGRVESDGVICFFICESVCGVVVCIIVSCWVCRFECYWILGWRVGGWFIKCFGVIVFGCVECIVCIVVIN